MKTMYCKIEWTEMIKKYPCMNRSIIIKFKQY